MDCRIKSGNDDVKNRSSEVSERALAFVEEWIANHVTAKDAEGSSNYRTLDELLAALDSESFWRPHRSYLVNIHHIKEVVPWFKSSFMLKMNDKKQSEIPVSRLQTKRLRELFNL